MANFLQPVSPNASTLNSVGGSSLYPTSPTLTSAQAEASPLSSGIQDTGGYFDQILQGGLNDPNIPGGTVAGGTATLGGTASGGTAGATAAIQSASGIISTLQNLLSGTSLERGLIILIGVIMLGIGLWMLKGGTTVNIAGAVARAT